MSLFRIKGIVQGVGFRPAAKRLADELQLSGWVQNCGDHVLLALEDKDEKVLQYLQILPSRLHLLANIEEVKKITERSEPIVEPGFVILASEHNSCGHAPIPPDLTTCSQCLQDMLDPQNRRFLYPFISCSHCGPRYSITKNLPYDRSNTTLHHFKMCVPCTLEFENPNDRRFHAENISCPTCGPSVRAIEHEQEYFNSDALVRLRHVLAEGGLALIKGIGGFQLCGSASSLKTVQRIRALKSRTHQPLALMTKNLQQVKEFCLLDNSDANLLQSSSGPIVLLKLDSHKGYPFTQLTDSDRLGVMLPSSGLHHLLWQDSILGPLVVTSGNVKGALMSTSFDEIDETLFNQVDLILDHNRPIANRIDDAVVETMETQCKTLRSGRGLSPNRMASTKHHQSFLALGGDQKNALCTFRKHQGIVTLPHHGDLHHPKTLQDWKNTVTQTLKNQEVDTLVIDKHPHYHSSAFGRQMASKLNLNLVEVQHHHAHGAAVMAEYTLTSALALIFDGTGYGNDGTLWGAEGFLLDGEHFERCISFAPAPLPGSEACIREPRRQWLSRWTHGEQYWEGLGISKEMGNIWLQQIDRKLNCPWTHGAGRLFDAVAAVCCPDLVEISYEGQAAIRLEALAHQALNQRYRITDEIHWFQLKQGGGLPLIDWSLAHQFVIPGCDPLQLSLNFHHQVCQASTKMAEVLRSYHNMDDIILSGGVFNNRLLCHWLSDHLKSRGFRVFIPQHPCGDGGIALGQAWVALQRQLNSS